MKCYCLQVTRPFTSKVLPLDATHVLEERPPFAQPAPLPRRNLVLTQMFRLLLLFAAGGGFAVPYVASREATDQIKASYIFNFLKFVTFPADALQKDNVVRVCLVGRDHFGATLDAIDGRSTGQASVQIDRLGPYRADLSVEGCHVIYITDSEAHKTQRILASIDRQKCLTIGEHVPFIAQGGMIELFEKDDTIRFRINAELVRDAKFQIASQLILLGVE